MLFIKYSILILGCVGALGGFIIGLKSLPAFLKKCGKNQHNGFMMLPFAFGPLTQAVYAWILWMIISSNAGGSGQDQAVDSKSIITGLAIGLVLMLVAVGKSLYGKKACRLISETGKGFNKYMIIYSFIETIAIFAFIFGLITLKLN